MSTSSEQDVAVDLIVNRKFKWCRARLFHALAGAAEQGVLAEVLDEIFGPYALLVSSRIHSRLRNHGWLK